MFKFRIEYVNGDFDVVVAFDEKEVWVEYDGDGINRIVNVEIIGFCY